MNARRRLAAAGDDESGAAIIEVLMAMGAALVFTAFLVNALLMLYARSVIQHAADVGARAAARSGGTEMVCVASADQVIADLADLYADQAQVECTRGEAVSTATITARLDPVFPSLGPDWTFEMRASSVTEPVP